LFNYNYFSLFLLSTFISLTKTVRNEVATPRNSLATNAIQSPPSPAWIRLQGTAELARLLLQAARRLVLKS